MSKRPRRAIRAALYVRVSTADKQHPANQTAPLRDWCKKAGHFVAAEFVDRESGSSATRPAFQQMLEAARRHEFDLVVFWSLDRFSREGIAATFEHLRTLATHQVDFYSLQDPFCRSLADEGDLAARASRELLMAIAAWVAEYERRRRQERVKAGMDRARKEGKHIGRRRYWNFTSADTAQMMDLHRNGISLLKIADKLSSSKSTIQRRITEELKRLAAARPKGPAFNSDRERAKSEADRLHAKRRKSR